MNNSSQKSISVQEKLGRRRFDSGIEFEKQLLNTARIIQRRILNNLPSNYPKNQNTNIAEAFLAISEEFSRLRTSISQINENRYHAGTQAQYLYEILGDVLFLDQRAINTLISDEEYRSYLITVRNAYYGGSRKDNIESSVSEILGLPVELKELYLNLRQDNSFYTLKDTHTMFFNILMDSASSTNIGLLLESIKFFIDLIKPAHVLYDTRLIWTDTFYPNENKCEPLYDPKEISEIIFWSDRIYLLTYAITSLYLSNQDDPDETWDTGTISSIDQTRSIIYLTNNRILVVNNNSSLYRRTYDVSGEHTDVSISFSILSVGDVVRYYSTIDNSTSSNVIEDDWRYVKTISSIDENDEIITLTTGEKIVYNDDILIYTRDNEGEYRITISDLDPETDPERVIRFRATKHTSGHHFYNIPTQVKNNPYKEYDQEVINRPYYQANVQKILDTYNGLTGGPHVVMVEGVATVIDVNAIFYKRSGKETYSEYEIYRYNLYIQDEFKKQFSIEEPNEPITEDEAKVIFENIYGYSFTGSNSDYRIDIDRTAHLKQSTEDTIIEGITGATEFCDRQAECILTPYYEDTRKYWEYPDLQLTSGFVIAAQVLKVDDPSGEVNIRAYFNISSDPNIPIPAKLPILNAQGNIATASDIVVYVDGLKVDDSVSSLDPWTGEISLNFLPPANTTTRIDYYYADRYPKSEFYIEQVGSENKSQRLYWPYTLSETGAYNLGGGSQDFQVDKFPILDQEGNLAEASDIDVLEGSIGATGSVNSIEQSSVGDTLIVDGGLSGIEPGDTMIIYAENYLDNTIIYEVVGTTGTNKIITDKEFGIDIDPSGFPYDIIRFTGAPYNADDVRPLLGHIHLETGPDNDKFIRFNYYYQYRNRYYTLIPDVAGDTSPYMNMGYTADTNYGSFAGYTLLPDMGVTGTNEPYIQYNQIAKKGYRYRAFDLSNSSVLDSRDTLILNGYQRFEGEASWKNNRNRLDDYHLLFSPEHLTDRDKDIILNDAYLNKNLTPNTQLYPGTPPFVKTFSDDAGYKLQSNPESENTYQDPTKETHDLSAGFTIVGTDESGLVDYDSVCEYEKKKRLSLYSSLKVVETDIEGYPGPLSTIEEGMRTMPIKSTYIDVYYPNREKRINDYLDYINEISEEIREGTVKTLNNSPIIKRIKGQWLNLKIGDMLNVKNAAYRKYNSTTDKWEILYKDVVYTIIEIIDYETARLSSSFKEMSGEYDYELIRDRVYNVDTLIMGGAAIWTYDSNGNPVTGAVGELNRLLVPNTTFDYGLAPAVVAGLSGVPLYFADPDQDAYPRSPDNPNITGLPTGDRTVLLSYETGLGPTDVDSIPYISEIIGADGSSVVTGLSGFTGPSGAVDLGLTGPTDEANIRILDADDKYLIPSGESGTYISYSESEYRVQWRNWDQEKIIVSLGSSTGPAAGVIEEEPMGLYDDLAEGIKRNYWHVQDEALVVNYYFGTVVETSEQIEYDINANSYPEGFIVLTEEQATDIALSSNPKQDFPYLDPGISSYNLNRRIIREILHDNTIKITEIQELVPFNIS